MLNRIKLSPGVYYVAPAILVIAFVMVYPLIYTIYLSFHKSDLYSVGNTFVGLAQYVKLFQDNYFINSIKATFYWTAGSVVFQFLLGFAAALLLSQPFVRFKGLIRMLIMIPWVLPSIIGVNIWKWSYHPDFGLINYYLKSLGLIGSNLSWVSNPDTALLSAVIVNIWKMFPLVMLMIEAALQSVPVHLKDAARVDGAGSLRTFMTVTVPHVSPACYTIVLLLIIWTLNAFTFIFALTGGGPAHASEIMSMFIYNYAFKSYKFGLASAASVILFLITAGLTILYVSVLMRRGEWK